MKIDFFMICLLPFKLIQVSNKFLKCLSSSGDLNMLERTQANHEELNFHFSRPHTALSVLLLEKLIR